MAGLEYQMSQKKKEDPKFIEPPKIGIVPCFCKNQTKKGYDLTVKKYKFQNDINDITYEEPLCKNWLKIENQAGNMELMISKGIVISNVLIRKFIIVIIDLMGSHTETSLIKNITTSVFVCVFINTGVLIMLNNADLSS